METKRTRVCCAGCLSATTEMHILKKLDDDSASLHDFKLLRHQPLYDVFHLKNFT